MTDLKETPGYADPATCDHLAFNEYEILSGPTDDLFVANGRCPECNLFARMEFPITSKDPSDATFTPLDHAEIARLRKAAMEGLYDAD